MQNDTHTQHQKNVAYAIIAGYCSGYVATAKMFATSLRDVIKRAELSNADRDAMNHYVDLLIEMADRAQMVEAEERKKAGLS